MFELLALLVSVGLLTCTDGFSLKQPPARASLASIVNLRGGSDGSSNSRNSTAGRRARPVMSCRAKAYSRNIPPYRTGPGRPRRPSRRCNLPTSSRCRARRRRISCRSHRGPVFHRPLQQNCTTRPELPRRAGTLRDHRRPRPYRRFACPVDVSAGRRYRRSFQESGGWNLLSSLPTHAASLPLPRLPSYFR